MRATAPQSPLLYDWNQRSSLRSIVAPADVELLDETLRDGLQSPSVRCPTVQERVELVHDMREAGLSFATVGMPASSALAFRECQQIISLSHTGPMRLACAARAMPSDLTPVAELQQRTGVGLTAHAFVPTSALRLRVEGWALREVLERIERALAFAHRQELRTTLVLEDASRTEPQLLGQALRVGALAGAERICLCDTVGGSTPEGVASLVEFSRAELAGVSADVGLDFHGHNDQGLALANALSAIRSGASRIHVTALGVGERTGNTPFELLALQLHDWCGGARFDLSKVTRYAHHVSKALAWPIADNHPLLGRDAFRTTAGIHAAALTKARKALPSEVEPFVYSSLSASEVGHELQIGVGRGSGLSNVRYWLGKHGLTASPGVVQAMVEAAKSSERTLSEADLFELYRSLSFAGSRVEPQA
jgi:2-isopropylmalate synthase